MEIEVVKKKIDKEEIIVLRVLEDCNLWPYILLVSVDQEKIDSSRKSFIFGNHNVRKGDFLVVHTGCGETKHFKNRTNTLTHEYFWGFEDDIRLWEDGAIALLVKVETFTKNRV